MLLVAALVRATLQVGWDRPGVWMAAAGAAIVAASLVWNRREVREWFADPRGVYAVNTGLSVVLVIGNLALINILVWYRPFQVDLTASRRNTVTETTSDILRKLTRDVSLRQFGQLRDPRLDQLLASFGAASRRIRIEFVDADRSPQDARRYGIIKNGTVLVSAGDKYRKVETPTEQAIVTAVLQVTSDVDRTVCFVTGHGEHGLADESAKGLTRLVAALEASNLKVDRLSLLEGAIPVHCSAVVVPGPQRELEPVELERLTAFANQGGGIAVLIDPEPGVSLASWLEPFGIVPGAGTIIDTSGAGQAVGTGPQTPLAVAYADHSITRGFEVATLYDWARPLDVVSQPKYGGKPQAIAQTSNRSFEEMDPGPTVKFDDNRDRRGPLTLVAATAIKAGRPAQPQSATRGPDEMRLVVFGDSDCISNAFVSRQGNRDFFLRVVSWLIGEAEATIVRVEERENRRVELTERTRVWMYLVNIGLLPLLPLAAGVIALIRSKR